MTKALLTYRGYCLLMLGISLLNPFPLLADRAEDIVILDANAASHLGLQTVTVSAETFEETFLALGRIEPMPGGHAYVSSRIAGRLTAIDAHEGEWTQKDQRLVVVESLQPGDPPPSVSLHSPIDGMVTRSLKHLGEPVTTDLPILEIVNVRKMHAVAKIPEDKISQINAQTPVSIRVIAYPNQSFSGRWIRFGTEVDPESSTLEAYFEIEDPELRLRPAMRAEFILTLSRREGVIAVEKAAIQGDHYQPHVFVKDFEIPHAFIKAPVVTGASSATHVEIKGGLFPGDEVVTQGAYPLSFAGKGGISLKEALDAAHGHEHNEDGSEMTADQKAMASVSTEPSRAAAVQPAWVWFLACLCVLQWILLSVKWSTSRKNPS